MSIGTDASKIYRGFRMVPDKLWLDPRMQPVDIKLWCVLTFTARGREHTDATDATLAERMGISPQTVRRSLLRLEECRFIERKRQGEGRLIMLNPEGDGLPLAELELRVVG